MDPRSISERLGGIDRPRGVQRRVLVLGREAIGIAGLDADLAARLDARWGAFLHHDSAGPPRAEVSVLSAGPQAWLPLEREGEGYRLEAFDLQGRPAVCSYHFALVRQSLSAWSLVMTDGAGEPPERILDNAMRCIAARWAVEDGGFALHAAGVLREGRAYLFAGPSRAGKTTAVRLAAPAESLGDDFGLVIPVGDGFSAPALPFDNTERVVGRPTAGLFPVAGIFRLHQAAETRVDHPRQQMAVASLMACTAFPWILPDLADRLLGQVERFVSTGRFRHLHFAIEPGLWTHLVP